MLRQNARRYVSAVRAQLSLGVRVLSQGCLTTTACARPRISLNVIESLCGFEVGCAAGDAGRWA